jgi:hypothetical protein
MNKSVWILSGLLGASMVASYLSWTSEEGTDDDDSIVMLDAAPEQLERVTYTSEKLDVELEQRSDALGDYLWVTTREQKRVPSNKSHDNPDEDAHEDIEAPGDEPHDEGDEDEAHDEGAEEEAEYTTLVKQFKAGKAGGELLEALAPMEAQRVLQGVGSESYEDFGLVEPEATLSVTRKGKAAKEFSLGGEAYGTRDRYVLTEGTVYLVDQDLLRPLKYATTRLPDRDLFAVERGDMARVTVSSMCSPVASDCVEGSVELQQNNPQDPANASWSLAGSDQASETAEAWLDKALALKSAGYVQDDEQPTELSQRLQLLIETKDGLTTVAISQGLDEDGKEGWYATSEYTRGLVKLHKSQASEAADDVESVLEI